MSERDQGLFNQPSVSLFSTVEFFTSTMSKACWEGWRGGPEKMGFGGFGGMVMEDGTNEHVIILPDPS